MVDVVALAALGGFCLFAWLLGWQFVGYPLTMGLLASVVGIDGSPPTTADQPLVTVIVPSYNEESVVERRVTNLVAQTYPNDRYEVLFVDSGSTDGTPHAVREALASLDADGPPMELLMEGERNGKASAINLGLDRAQGEIVLVTDANTVFPPETIERVVPHFADPTVGAVAGQLTVLDADESLTGANQFYRDLEHMKAMGGSLLGSVCQFDGELSAWRAGLVRADETSLSEDLDLSVRVRKRGYRIAYEPRAVVSEPEPDTAAEQIASNKRRIVGTVQVLARHWRYLFVPADWYRGLVFPSRKTLPMLSPFLSIGAGGCFLVALMATPRTALVVGFVAALLGVGAFGALLAVRLHVTTDSDAESGPNVDDGPENDPSSIERIGAGDGRRILAVARYVAIIEYTILLAWWEFLIGAYSVRWQKSASDRR